MAKQQPQYVMVTKQRRKSGCIGGMFHLVGGLFTAGLWPLFVWLAHRIGPKRTTAVTNVYGPVEPSPAPPAAPQWTGPTTPPATPSAYDPATGQWAPPQQARQLPDDPWDGAMRRRT